MVGEGCVEVLEERRGHPSRDPREERAVQHLIEREFFIDNLLVRIHFTIVMIRWTGLAPWQFEFPCELSVRDA